MGEHLNLLHSLKLFSYKEQVARSISWGHYFIFLNILLACLESFAYVYAAPPFQGILSLIYMLVAWLGHMCFLTVVSYLVLFFPLAFIGNFRYYRVFAVMLASLLHTILLFDIKIFLMVKVHLSMTALNLIIRELDFDTGLNYNFLFVAIPIVVIFELVFAKITTHSLYKLHHPVFVWGVFLSLVACFVSSHVMHIWADAVKYEPITVLRSTLPAHYPMTARSFLSSHGWLSEERLQAASISDSRLLVSYPLGTIISEPQDRPYNVLVIAVNGLSYDNLSVELTPELLKLKQRAQSFEQNYLLYDNDLSNLYSMTYGLPLQYRSTLLSLSKSPVVIEEMFKQDFIPRLVMSYPEQQQGDFNRYKQDLVSQVGLRSVQLVHQSNDLAALDQASHLIHQYTTANELRPYAMMVMLNDLNFANTQGKLYVGQPLATPASVNAANADGSLSALYNSSLDSAVQENDPAQAQAQIQTLAQAQGTAQVQATNQSQAQAQATAQDLGQAQAQARGQAQDEAGSDAGAESKTNGQIAANDLLAEKDPAFQALYLYEQTLRHLDAKVGAMLHELRQQHLLEHTVVVITSLSGNPSFNHNSVFARQKQHVPLLVLWPQGQIGSSVNFLSSPQDMVATIASEVLHITTPSGNFTLGDNLKQLPDRDFLIVDGQNELVLVGKQDTVIYSQDGSSYVERDGKQLQIRPNLEDLIRSTRDLNRFLK